MILEVVLVALYDLALVRVEDIHGLQTALPQPRGQLTKAVVSHLVGRHRLFARYLWVENTPITE